MVSCFILHIHLHVRSRTLCSMPAVLVCARTTLCANLMQQIFTVGVAVSQIFKIFCFSSTMRSHVIVSYPLLMLFSSQLMQISSWDNWPSYIHLSANGYILDAVWITLLNTCASSFSLFANASRVVKTYGCMVSFSPFGKAGVANASARKSAPHLRSSKGADAPIIGNNPLITSG